MAAYVRPRPTLPVTTCLIAAILVTSLAAVLGDGTVFAWLALVPRDVWHGQLWRLATWALIEPGPLSLIFTCVVIHWCGRGLRASWGTARFCRYVAGIVAVAALGTSVLAFALPMAWWYPQLGGLALAKALLIAWALEFPDQRVVVYWFVVTGGRPLAYGTLGVTLVFTAYYGVVPMLPELLACIAALLYMNRSPRRWWLQIQALRAQARLDRYRRRTAN